ncbi:non-ribosomal peptide synthetase [Kitasatospora sp. NBC_00085]|uniref:amino acid adenylation domain-containing protein n=1 Tax=unclassified Kitasatospora TaxID=2633591 RepID=UPI003248B3DF
MSTQAGRATPPLPEQCVHDRFAERANDALEAVALECGGRRLTYAELDARAGQVAHLLRGRGVRPGVAVAVSAQRDLEVLVALLGVLKAGGHYLPLDPDYPAERLEFMLADSGARLLLVQPEFADRFAGAPGLDTVLMDRDWSAASELPTSTPAAGARPDDLAYVMYTSGSTGRPKGVEVTHRNIMRLVHEADYADLDPGQVMLMLAPLSFDASTFELWGALCNGARVAVLPQGVPTAASIEQAVRRHGVTVLFMAAGLFQHVVRTRPGALAGVRQVLVGGDTPPPAEVRTVLEFGVEVVNAYGPTECTTFSCARRGVTVAETRGNIPIGAGIVRTDTYVVDEAYQETPPGVAGELLIGGPGVARGYLGRPALTAERFVPDPFGTAPGARLYRTGDLASRDADGVLHYLGRRDQQVKILGHRVELGEIEVVLGNHPEVRGAAAAVRTTPNGEKQLVGYVLSDTLGPAAGGQLQDYLRERLPDFLVPTAWVRLTEFPLTPNGKLDRSALPAPVAGGDGPGLAPRTPLEQAVAEVWTELLNVAAIGVHDDFFGLGGNSLLATQAAVLLQERFPVDLPVNVVFNAPTVALLTEEVHRAIAEHVAQLSDTEVESMLSQEREG